MRPTYHSHHLVALAAVFALGMVGCDHQQPIAQSQRSDPGIKPGETPPVEPDKGPQRNSDGNIPVPPATAPTTPGAQNSPAAPVPFTPPPTSSAADPAPVIPPPSK